MPEEQKPAETEVEALTRQLGERDHAFGELKARLEKAEAAAASAQAATDIATATTAALTDTIARYQSLLTQTNPEIPAEMIKGGTVAELDASLISGKAIVQKVRESLEAQAQATPIPAGAPARTGIDLSSLSPHEKIIEGLKQHDRRK